MKAEEIFVTQIRGPKLLSSKTRWFTMLDVLFGRVADFKIQQLFLLRFENKYYSVCNEIYIYIYNYGNCL